MASTSLQVSWKHEQLPSSITKEHGEQDRAPRGIPPTVAPRAGRQWSSAEAVLPLADLPASLQAPASMAAPLTPCTVRLRGSSSLLERRGLNVPEDLPSVCLLWTTF